MDIKERVKQYIDEHISEEKTMYEQGLVSSSYEIKGVRIPDLEVFAKQLVEEGVQFKDMPLTCHEEIMLAGMVISYTKVKPEENFTYEDFLNEKEVKEQFESVTHGSFDKYTPILCCKIKYGKKVMKFLKINLIFLESNPSE